MQVVLSRKINFGLNEEQEKAVYAPDGPLLLLAGAGSGKTRALIARIAHLIERGVPPESIMAITFTNKAADEMKSRLEKYVGNRGYQVMAGTFHSVANRLIRIFGKPYGFGDYRILDDDESWRIIHQIATAEGGNEEQARELKIFIDQRKNENLLPSDIDWGSRHPVEMVSLYRTYQSVLQDRGYMDFGDLIIYFNRLMDVRRIREKVHERFKHILIDEYQDINDAQYRMVQNLAGYRRNLWVVGDPDQAIYAFRGASLKHILNFQKDFPEAQVMRLERNYRSTKTIVEATNRVIERNSKRLDKTVWTSSEAGEPITVIYPANPNQEAAWIADKVRDLVNSGVDPNEIAVLYRTHRQANLLDESFSKRNIPFRIAGQTAFYNRQEIKDAFAYIRLATWKDDTEALLRILNVPRRGMGEKAQEAVAKMIDQGLKTDQILDLLISGNNGLAKSSKRREGARQLKEILDSLPDGSAAETVPAILEMSGVLEHYANGPEAPKRLAHLNRLVEIALSFGPWIGLEEFVDEVRLRSEEAASKDAPMVTLMTAHASKGTEFDYVFIVGLNANIFPMYHSDIEEERRLFYVACTRARHKLYLSSPKTVVTMTGQLRQAARSPFISELPAHLLYQMTTLKVG